MKLKSVFGVASDELPGPTWFREVLCEFIVLWVSPVEGFTTHLVIPLDINIYINLGKAAQESRLVGCAPYPRKMKISR